MGTAPPPPERLPALGDTSSLGQAVEALRMVSAAPTQQSSWSRSLTSATAHLLDALARDTKVSERTLAAGERLARRVLSELPPADAPRPVMVARVDRLGGHARPLLGADPQKQRSTSCE